MKELLLLFTLASGLLPADNPRARFQQIQSEARTAAAAGDARTAETKYLVLLDLAQDLGADPQEVYASVVTPLAQIYRQLEDSARLEALYESRVGQARAGLELGLAQADLGFHLQNNDTSAYRLRGEDMVEEAIRTFANCGTERAACSDRLLETSGLQGAVFFQQGKYAKAEPFFRRVLAAPEPSVQKEVLLVSMHALRGILVLRKDFEEARALELRAAAIEAQNPAALERLRGAAQESSRSRD